MYVSRNQYVLIKIKLKLAIVSNKIVQPMVQLQFKALGVIQINSLLITAMFVLNVLMTIIPSFIMKVLCTQLIILLIKLIQ